MKSGSEVIHFHSYIEHIYYSKDKNEASYRIFIS